MSIKPSPLEALEHAIEMGSGASSSAAFPGEVDNVFVHLSNDKEPFKIAARQSGMTLRDYFAAKALQGWVSTLSAADVSDYDGEPEAYAEHQAAVAAAAYGYADAMLRERAK